MRVCVRVTRNVLESVVIFHILMNVIKELEVLHLDQALLAPSLICIACNWLIRCSAFMVSHAERLFKDRSDVLQSKCCCVVLV